MLSYLYPLGFFGSLLGLIMWFYYQDQPQRSRVMSKLFLGGFFVYLFSLAFANGDLSNKLLVLFRDLVILGLVSQFFNFFRKNKLLFIAMMIILLGAFKFFGFEKMMNTFPIHNPKTASTAIELDKDGELLVEITENHHISELETTLKKYGLTYKQAFEPQDKDITDLDDYLVVDIPDDMLQYLDEIQNELRTSDLVDWVEQNEVIRLDPMESATTLRSNRNFGLNDPGIAQLWGFEKMEVDQLYSLLASEKLKPTKKSLIAILDTGIDAKHEDIKANYKSINSKHDNDPQSHGTHCAGIAAAVSNNAKGIASFSQDNSFVQVSSIRVLSSFGGGTQQNIIKGMLEAADKSADVISMSLGGRSTSSRQRAYARAVNYCNRKGAIVVVAAGNSRMDAKDYSPANTPGVITVSAVGPELNKADFSNFVTNLNMGIAAPGVSIYSTIPNNKYASFNGTSMATPYVAGLIGLLKSLKPSLTTKEVYNILKQTGIETGNTQETGRFIQPTAAVKTLLK